MKGLRRFTALSAVWLIALTSVLLPGAEVQAAPRLGTGSTVTVSQSRLPADNSTPTTITVTLRDPGGALVVGDSVALVFDGDGPSANSNSQTTDANGQATFTVRSSKDGTFTITAIDTTGGGSEAAGSVQVTFSPLVSAANSSVSASPGSVTADGSSTATVTVTVKDAGNTPIVGDTVSLSGTGNSTITAINATTNASGQATFSVKNSHLETVTYTATDTTGGANQSIGQTSVSFTAGSPVVGNSSVSASTSSVVADGATPVTITVTLRDANNNPVSGQSVSLAAGSGSSTINSPTATTNASGVATFQVTDTRAESVTYTASLGSTPLAPTVTVTFTAGPFARLLVLLPGESAAPGSATGKSGTPSAAYAGTPFNITVSAVDAHFNPVPGVSDNVTLTSSDGQFAAFGLALANGTATQSVTLKTAGTQWVRASDASNGAIVAGTSSNLTVNPGAATSLSVTAPASVGIGSSFGVTVTAKDPFGNTATGYRGTVHASSSDGQATLPADYTFVAADNGSHSFSVALRSYGSRTVTFTDTQMAFLTGSATVGVGTGGASSFGSFSVTASPGSVTAGGSVALTVTALDALGNVNPTYSGTVRFTSSDPLATLPALYTFQPGDYGSHTFTGVVLRTPGLITLTATDYYQPLITGTSAGITVGGAGSATAAYFTITPGVSSVTAGTPLSLIVVARDALGNVASGYTGTVRFTSSDPQATLPGTYTFQLADGGIHTFTGVVLRTPGQMTVSAIDYFAPSVAGTSGAITVTGNAGGGAASLSVTASASSTYAGSGFSLTVTARDIYGNTATGYTGTVRFVSTDPQATLPTTYTFQPGDYGSHTFTGVVLRTPGIATISAIDYFTPTITGTTSGITVMGWGSNGGAVAFSVIPSASSTVAGSPITLTVTVRDALGNNAYNYTGTVRFTSSDPLATLPANYTFQPGDYGRHTFTGVVLRTPGTATISVNDVSTPWVNGTSSALSVGTSSPAASFVLTSSVTAASVGSNFTLTVRARDIYGNTATTYTGTVRFSSSDRAAILPATYTFTAADLGVHVFSLALNTAGNQTVTVTDAYNPAISATSGLISVTPQTTASLTLSPAGPLTVQAGQNLTFRYIAYDARGNVITGGTPTWTVRGVGTVSGGVFSSTRPGQATVTVSVDGRTATSGLITVTPGAPRSLTVSASATTVPTGGSLLLSASATDAYGNVISNPPVVWSASSGGVDSSGFFLAPASPGTVVITATTTMGGSPVSGSLSLTVISTGGSGGGTGSTGGSTGGTGGSSGGSSGSGGSGGGVGGSSGGSGNTPGTYAGGLVVMPSYQPLPPDAVAATSPAVVSGFGQVQVTFVVDSSQWTHGLLAYYYDSRFQTWVAVPTAFGLNASATATLPAGVPVVLMRLPQIDQPADLNGTWADSHVLKLESLGIMALYPDGGFHPDEPINRYTVARAMALALGLNTTNPDYTQFNRLPDRGRIPAEYRPYVAAVLNAGIMVGTGDGFGGETILTRAQMATLIGRAIRTGIEGPLNFVDRTAIPDWALSGVGRAVAYDIMTGFEDGTFRPGDLLTRAQFAKIISQLIDAINPPS